ncbi:hypothetical protein [Microvirga massiliensis]|uniref:hypothetical protein n=1 Tax=Microvirga massiliensis TaxID=1033741 RepID=UPI00062B442F|nr:hypothetical protein [Microvirga massiliensis]
MPTPASIAPTVFERNNFYYGKLMDVDQFWKDAIYANGKRWMLNRVMLASGTAGGLDVVGDMTNPGFGFIRPGLAIDPVGRELVLAEDTLVDLAQPTDDLGVPTGARLTTGVTEIALVYAERLVDAQPILVPDCDGSGQCAAGTVREDVIVVVRSVTQPAPVPAGCTLPGLTWSDPVQLHAQLSQWVRTALPDHVADVAVPLARYDVAQNTINNSIRPLALGSMRMFELLQCLSGQLVAPTAMRFLEYRGGDGQEGDAGRTLPTALEVRLIDGLGQPVAGETVQFVPDSGGRSTPKQVETDDDGLAKGKWKLGSAVGTQHMVASVTGATTTVTFTATAN